MRFSLAVFVLGATIVAAPAFAAPKVGAGSEQSSEKSQSTDVPDKANSSAGAAKSEGTGEGRQTPSEKKAGGSK